MDGNTELRPECPALTLAVLTLAETRRPQVRAASRQGSARKRRSGTPLVQREARSCKAREKTIHHGHSFLTHPPPSPSDSPGGAGLRASDLFTASFFCFLGDFFPPTPTRLYTARCWSVSARRVFPSFLGDESGSLTYVEHRVQFELVEDEGFKEGRRRARWCNLE